MVGFNRFNSDYLTDPRVAFAQQNLATGASVAPAASPVAALARALQGAVGGYQQGQVRREYQGRADKYSSDLAKVLAAGNQKEWTNPDTGQVALKGGVEGIANAIRGVDNPDLADFGQQVQLKGVDQQREDALKLQDRQFQREQQDRLFGQQSSLAAMQDKRGLDKLLLEYQLKKQAGELLRPYEKARDEARGKEDAKVIADTPDVIRNSADALQNLQKAKGLNELAYSGALPAERAGLMKAFGFDKAGVNATAEFKNALDTNALKQLKEFVGSTNISNADRESVTALQGALNLNPAARGAIIDKNIGTVQRLIRISKAKQDAALSGRPFTDADIQKVYAEDGLDYRTGQPVQAPPQGGGISTSGGELFYDPATRTFKSQ